ncbi:AraC family transcriptional regulator [Clostridium taeniosporum]|uniref:AraC family transcriptional regulator n=1 Tax=Clostridium taeniosporum TaxID=394958 RepID=A0A1D7XJZ5_9CLOT|nr:AraC family transcriptional regulator [Clostridium taeniosporum]AOR23429.1 AraC family transcriptional regulator [Clostridium taeniosporum]
MNSIDHGNKYGYLHSDFKLFHIKDKKNQEFEFHYHEFNKIIIFLSGNVTYLMEGKAYYLKPWDILLVNNHAVHKPLIDSSKVYERIVIWVNSDFIESHNYNNCDLMTCFKLANKKSFNLIRLDVKLQDSLKSIIASLEKSLNSKDFGSKLLSNSLFIQFLIYLNRIYLEDMFINDESSLKYDKQVEEILKYINTNISKNLSIDFLSKKFFISKYYLMHKFKKETGYTLHNYILQKRLLIAKDLIEHGEPILKVSAKCGFKDYSNFLRSFKKLFNKSPRELSK